MNSIDTKINTLSTSISKGEIVLYQPNESVRLEVRLENDTVWLTQAQMAELFSVKVPAVSKHIKNIYEEGELESLSTVSKKEIVRKEGSREVRRQVDFYNLDVIISVGYRIRSLAGTRFRQWATNVLKEFMLRGYSVSQHLIALQERIDGRFATLESHVEEHQQQIEFLLQREQSATEQLFSTGCVWDAYTFVSDLVRSATSRLILIDPFVDERTLLILDKRRKDITCTVHTHYCEQVELDFQKHNQQCVPIQKVQLSHAVHDRYLIIDNEVWLLGASVKDMGRGLCTIIKLGFMPDDILARI